MPENGAVPNAPSLASPLMAPPSTVASMVMGIGEVMLTVHARLAPYNKDFSRFRHRVGRRLAATRLRGPML